ncbi:MAG: response regulator, partial [Verrucomicrobiota bacterium]
MTANSPNTILIIDDSEDKRYLFSRYLQQDGFEVWTANTAREGLEMAQKNPSLIMLDIVLPDMTGYELCRLLKNDPFTSSIPILHTSATFTQGSEIAYGLSGGADGYLTQPIDPQELTATVRALLRVRAAESSAKQLAAQLELKVAERTASLQDAIRQMEQFSYTITHDLRAPLRAMQGYSNVLLEDYAKEIPQEAQDYLQKIAQNAARLDKMILDVLTFTRLSKETPILSKISLKKLVHTIIEDYPGLKPPHAKIEVILQHDVMANESGLTQALSNLLGNAVKFVAPGVIPEVRIWSEARDKVIRIWIEDN